MFKPVTPDINFVEIEKELLQWWHKSGVVEKYLHRNDSSKEKFSFLDGPITANNPMGVHHAWGRTYKDLWQRFFNMRGFKQRFQNGFDNQGLWVEVEVEKALGFKSKKDIETFGIDKFVEKCKEHTLKYAQIQTEQSKRLGYFMDWGNSYYTMSDENNYMIWHFLKKCHDNGWLYKGKDSVPWCPRCGTAISQHEILTEEYKELTHTAAYFKCYRLDTDHPSAFLVWTTTPWTIPADIALAVNPDLIYAEFEIEGEKETLVFAKDLGPKVLEGKKWKVRNELKGNDLVGEQYTAPFDDLPVNIQAKKDYPKTYHIVFLEKDLVTAEEGTGIVHIVPGAGTEDFKLGIRESLPVLSVIDEAALYIEGYGNLTGKNAKEHPELIFDVLKEKEEGKYLFKLEDYTHRYPKCWRCKTELVWRVVDEWYIKMDPLRDPMRKVVEKINWIPSWGKNQEIDWINNMHDWLISKKRYWGLALPIWECDCGHFEVVDSKEDLKKKAAEGWEKFEKHTPHRPWIDEVKVKCPKCQKIVSRIKDVGNPWLDAGIVPFSTLVDPKTKKVSYLSDKEYWKEWFPANFVTESFPGQFKNWFYSLLVMSTVLKNTNPFESLFGYATVMDEKGEEMHKSKGNAIWFDEAAEKIGVDVMRWMYVSQNPENNLNFGYHVADGTRRRFHLMLWNIYNFFVTYANIDRWERKPENLSSLSQNILDRWIVSRLNELVKTVTESLAKYDAYTASHAIEDFVSDLSTWYVRRSRSRIGPTAENGEDKAACYQTLYETLVILSKVIAPFTPFLAEEMYKNLTAKESVHLTDWPGVNESLVDENLEKEMREARRVVEMAHARRKEAEIKVRQPLNSLATITPVNLPTGIRDLIKDEVNVKSLDVKVSDALKVGDLPQVTLDTEITPALKAEGDARDLVRQIQDLRKKSGCRLDEKIVIFAPFWPKDFEDYIKEETLAEKITVGDILNIDRKSI